MSPVMSTTTCLLDSLQDESNQAAWTEFDHRYRPIVFGLARKLGLSDPDAADIAQETLTRFIQDYRARKYDRSRGRLRAWLVGIARFRIADFRRSRARRKETRGESGIAPLPGENEMSRIWDAQERDHILSLALAELRTNVRMSERTIDAFERVALRGEPVATVAAELDLSQQEVYEAKSRVVAKLREVMQRYEAEFVEP